MSTAEKITKIIEARSTEVFLINAESGASLTYGQLDMMARRLAVDFSDRGIVPGARVGLLLGNSVEFAVLYFACLYAGVTAVPVNPQLSPRETSFILEHAGLREILFDNVTQSLLLSLPDVAPGVPRIRVSHTKAPDSADTSAWWCVTPSVAAGWETPSIQDDALFSLNFTSGTTSLPKGVPHRVSSLFDAALAFNMRMGIQSTHRFGHVLPMAYMAGFLNTLLCPFVAGASVVVNPPFGPQTLLHFWDPMRRHEVNVLWLVPTMLAALLRGDRDPEGRSWCHEHIQMVCVGTAPLTGKLKNDFEQAYGVALHESYGLSETLFVAANAPSLPFKEGSVGRPLDGVTLRIESDEGLAQPTGQDGEITVCVPWNMAGYFNYERGEPDALVNDWFPSGDVGHLDPDGYLYITARKKDLIIRGGQNISPRTVEEVIETHPSVMHVGVVGVPHEFYGEEIIAVLTLVDGAHLDSILADLQQQCRSQLGAVAVPTRYLQIGEMPVGVTGKLQKNKLRDWVLSHFAETGP